MGEEAPWYARQFRPGGRRSPWPWGMYFAAWLLGVVLVVTSDRGIGVRICWAIFAAAMFFLGGVRRVAMIWEEKFGRRR